MISRLLTILLLASAAPANADEPYRQLFAGYNGLDSSETVYFDDEASVRDSWVADALGAKKLNEIISKVHFDSEVLVVSSVGERSAVTQVELAAMNRYGESLTAFVLIGVAGLKCPSPRPDSYPFVIGVVAKPKAFDGVTNYFHQNFPDECKPVQSGQPTRARPNNSFKPTPHRGVGHVPALR
jgi:hypothetical protein